MDFLFLQHLGSIQFLLCSGLARISEEEYVDPEEKALGGQVSQKLRKRFGPNAISHEMLPWFEFGLACWSVGDLVDSEEYEIQSVIRFVLGGADSGGDPSVRTPEEELLIDLLVELSQMRGDRAINAEE